MPEGLDKLAGAIGDTLKTAPTIYEDALQPTVQEVGKFVARIPRAINAAFSGLDKWILNREYAIDETKKLLEIKLKNVNPEKIVTPEAYVAVPAIQAISYSMDSEELRNLYANLLAKAMNSDTKDMVHPSFVEIIKQLSPSDADIFKLIFERDNKPLIDLSINMPNGGKNFFASNISWITSYDNKIIRIALDNLTRLGLIEIRNDGCYTEDAIYNIIRNTNYFSQVKQSLLSQNIGTIDESKKYINCTTLASSFYRICINE